MPSATPQETLAAGCTPSRAATSCPSPIPRPWASRSHAAVSIPARANGLPRTPACSAASTADRKSTRLNSSHLVISYAVFCLKKKNKTPNHTTWPLHDDVVGQQYLL